MIDLHARLLAAVSARRALAEAATPGPWSTRVAGTGIRSSVPYAWVLRPDGAAVLERHNYGTLADINHAAANDPAQILRDTAAHLGTLEDHNLVYDNSSDDDWQRNPRCADCDRSWPCREIIRLASAYPEVSPIQSSASIPEVNE